MRDFVSRIRAKFSGVRIIGATVTPALGSTNANHGSPEEDAKRKALNQFIRAGGLFDGVADFDVVILDPQTGGMRAEFVPESTTGGPGDKLHPNRVGYLVMDMAIDLNLLVPMPLTPRCYRTVSPFAVASITQDGSKYISSLAYLARN